MATVTQAQRGRFVGRREELAAVDGVLDTLRAPRVRWLVVSGEPGIGKTRLLGELAARAAERRHPVFVGRGAELEHPRAGPPGQPGTGRRAEARHAHVDVVAVGQQLQLAVPDGEPVGGAVDRALTAEELEDEIPEDEASEDEELEDDEEPEDEYEEEPEEEDEEKPVRRRRAS